MNQLNKVAHYLILIFSISAMAGCAVSKSAYSPAGTWDYEVKNTPNGDRNGKMVITKEGDEYAGNFQTTEYGTLEMRDLMLEGNALQSNFYVQGEAFKLNGLFEGNSFTGKITSNYGTFDVTADRAQ